MLESGQKWQQQHFDDTKRESRPPLPIDLTVRRPQITDTPLDQCAAGEFSRPRGPVAQLVEQLTFNQWVTGSNPVGLTIPVAKQGLFPPALSSSRMAPCRNMVVSAVLASSLQLTSSVGSPDGREIRGVHGSISIRPLPNACAQPGSRSRPLCSVGPCDRPLRCGLTRGC